MTRIHPFALMSLALLGYILSALPSRAVDYPPLLEECAPGAPRLHAVFVPFAPAAPIGTQGGSWLQLAAALPDDKAGPAYAQAVRNMVDTLKTAGVHASPTDVLVYRYVMLKDHKKSITPFFSWHVYAPEAPINREIDMIIAMLPKACFAG